MYPDLLAYYRAHGPMSQPGAMLRMVTGIPQDIAEIVRYVQNVLLHQHWSKAYGVELTEEKKREPHLRSFAEKLSLLSSRGLNHVSEEMPVEAKVVGICRDFSVAAAALCREAGISARARCGFATYFTPGKFEDHWVLEYWNEAEQRWVMVDAQLDELQQKALKITFDPLDVGEDDFIIAPRAWKMCRQGQADPNLFGIFQWWGYDYLNCNLILDVNSLLKVPMQPWDNWRGYKSLPTERWKEADFETIDKLADLALAVDECFSTFAQFVLGNEMIRVPFDLREVNVFDAF